MKVGITLVTGLLLGFIACLSVAQAQVYLPGLTSLGQEPPGDIDPDIFGAFTDTGFNRSNSQSDCGSRLSPCVGGLMHQFYNPRIEQRDGAEKLVFDWQIKAAQPPETTDITELVNDGKLANLLARMRLLLYLNTAAFGKGAGEQSKDNWGPGCKSEESDVLAALRRAAGSRSVHYNKTGRDDDGLQMVLANTLGVSQEFLDTFGDDFRALVESLILPHEEYRTMAEIACPIAGSNDQPARFAFQGLMMGEDGQRIKNPEALESRDEDTQSYAAIATNNLWYYPLDGAPAIIDAELGAGGPGLAYLDLTFSEEVVATSSGEETAAFVAAFNATTISMAGMANFDNGAPNSDAVELEVSRVTRLSSTVLRIHFEDDLRILAERVSPGLLSSSYFVFITPPATGIEDVEGRALHSGDDWRLAVFFDHAAPYIQTAEVSEEGRAIEIVFDKPVQFGIEFNVSLLSPPTVITGSLSLPSPSTGDFIIVRYRGDGSAERFSPVAVGTPQPPRDGITELTLVMPTDREYSQGDTFDVRIARRLKDPTHPSFASVFTFVNNELASIPAEKLKTSKFGVGPSNFPRTAAFAQVGSLPLRVVEPVFELSFVPMETSVIAGGMTEVMVVLTGDTELIEDDFTVIFSYEPPDGGVSAEDAILNADITSATVSLMATEIAQDGTLTASVSEVDGATIESATLAVEIVKEIIPRSYSLTFDVAAVSVVGGGTTEVMVVLTGDTELIGEDEFTVIFSYEPPDGGVSAEDAMLNADITSATVSLVAMEIAQDGTLTASVSGVDGATIESATLAVEIVREIIPRSYSLSLTTLAGLGQAQVVAGGTTEVMVVLTGDTELIGEDEFTVIFSYDPQDGGVSVDEAVILNADITSATVSLVATAIAQDGTLTAAVADAPENVEVVSAVLPVRVLHELVLSFTAPGGASLETARVLAGGTTKVAVRLANPGSLGEGEKVQVSFATATTKVSVIPPEWTLTAERPSTIFTIEARHDVDPPKGTVVASGEVMLNGARVLDTRVVSTALAVEIVERRFRLSILDEAGISSSPLRVLEGSEVQLRLRLLSVSSSLGTPSLGEDEMLTVLLIFTNGNGNGTGNGILPIPRQVTFFRGSTETEVVLLLRGRSSEDTLTAKAVEFGLRNVAVESTSVAMEIIPRSYRLSFDVATVSVVAGGAAQVGLTLTGDTGFIGENEAFVTTFTYIPSDPDGGGVEVVALAPAMFTADNTAAIVTLEAATTATEGKLTASVVGVGGTVVKSAVLPVEIVPRAFTLAFDATTVSVVAGGMTEVMVVLTGDTELIEDDFTVIFSYEPQDGGVSAEDAILNADITSATVSLMATEIAQDGTLTVAVLNVVGATFAPATLSVEIIPRSYSLAFDVAAVSVVAGGAAQVGLTLTGDTGFIGENEAFATTFTYIPSDPDGGGVEVVALAPAMFTADNTAAIVTLEAATTATGGKLTASVVGVGGTVVKSAVLPVEIVPRVFTLAFDATTVSVVAGGAAQVTLTLTGDRVLAVSDQFAVMFSYAPDDPDGGGVEVVALAPAMFMFTADNEYFRSTAVVTLEAATTATEGTLTASVVGAEGAVVESATLSVEITPRLFSLVFDVATVSVVAGATAQVGLALTGDRALAASDRFAVEFSYDLDGGVEVVALEPMEFSAGTTTATVTLSAATTAMGGVLTASVSEVDGAMVEPTTLTVTVIRQPDMPPPVVPLRVFTLSFLTLDNEPLADTTARVLAGGMTEVMVVLTGDTELIEDDFTVIFSYEPPDGGVSAEDAILNADITSATVSLMATEIAQDGTLTASVSEVDGATIESATLPVEIVKEIIPRSYSLTFDVAAVSVVAGGTTEVMVVLTGDTELIGEDEFTVIFSYEPPDGGVSAEDAMLNADITSAAVSLVAMEIAQDGTLTASVSGVDGATIESATLAVEIVKEIIPRSYSLTFDVAAVSVVAGGMTEVMVVLTGDTELIEDEFTVIFSYEPPDGGVSAEDAILNADITSATVSLVAMEIAQDGTLTASVSGVDGATIESATLAVEIVKEIIPRSYSLTFDVAAVSVVAGGTTEVMVVLTGDTELIGEDEFTVIFSYEPPDGGVSAEDAMLNADITSATVSLMATAIAQDGTLTVAVLDVVGATIKPATLPVQVFHELTFSFATATPGEMPLPLPQARVLAGGEARVRVVLDNPGLLEGDEAVRVLRVSLSPGLVNISEVEPIRLTSANTSATFVITAAHDTPPLGTVRVTGQVVSGDIRVANKRVAPITLAVEIVPRRFQLSLRSASPLGAQLDAPRRFVREASDGPLPIPDVVGMSANSIISVPVDIDIRWLAVQVEIQHPARGDLRVRLISPEGVDVLLHNRTGGFANNLSETYTSLDHAGLAVLTGGGARGNWELIVSHHDFNLSGSLQAWGLEINTITPERFVGEASDGPLPIPDLGEVNSIITVPVDTEIQSLAVRVEIRHPAEGDLRVRLISPEGVEVLLHDRTGGFADDLFRIYTSADQVGLAALTRGGTRGDWELIVADTRGTFTGTLEGWGLEINARTQLGTGESVPAVVTLSGVETLYGESRLFPSETLLVELRYTAGGRVGGVTMSPPTLEFHSLALTNSMMLEASLIQTSGLLELIGSGLTNAVVESTPVLVQVVRQFRLAFATPDGAPLAATRIMAGDATEVTVVLDNPETLGGGAVVLVTLSTEIVVASKSGLILTRARSSETLVISAPADADMPRGAVVASGELQLGDGTTADYIEVVAGSLAVEVILRAFRLAFHVAKVPIVAGATTQVTLTLTGDRVLAASDRFAVMFSYVPDDPDGGVEVAESVVFTAGSTAAVVTLEAATTAMTGRLMASVAGIEGATVAPATLSVEIVPRQFRLSLSPGDPDPPGQFSVTRRLGGGGGFSDIHDTIDVDEDIEVWSLAVRFRISGELSPRLQSVTLTLRPPEGEAVLLYGETRSFADVIADPTRHIDLAYTSADHTGLAALIGESAQGSWELIVTNAESFPAAITLEVWSLEINSVATVLAGGSAAVRVSLAAVETPLGVPRLVMGETLAVELTYSGTDAAGVSLPAGSMVMFDAESTAADVTLTAAFNAAPGTLTAVFAGAVPVNADVEPAALPVEIAPRRFQLSLSGAQADLARRIAREVRPPALIPQLPDPGPLVSTITVVEDIAVESLVVGVEIRHPDPGELEVVLTPPGGTAVTLHMNDDADLEPDLVRAYTSVGEAGLAGLVGSSTQGDWTLEVSDFMFGENTGTLESWYLEINTGVQVIAGGNVPVVVTLSGLDTPFGVSRLFADETLVVEREDDPGVSGVTLSPVMFQTADSTSVVEVALMLTAAPGATSGAVALSGSGLENAVVAPAVLPVEIVPRAFTLAFDATTVSVVAGGTTQVGLALTGDTELIGENEAFAVMFLYAPDGGVEVVESVEFSEGTTAATVTLSAATTAMGGVLEASALNVDGATVAPATLDVEITLRLFSLAFDATTVSVVAGGTTQVGLTLTGDTELIGENEAFAVMFLYAPDDPDGGDVRFVGLESVMFTRGNTEAVVTLEAATTATRGMLTALVLKADGAAVAPARLSVEIIPRAFTLAFDLASVSVVAGATAQVTLTLTGDRALAASERFAVEFSYDLDGGVEVVALEPMEFSAGTTTATVTLSAATTAMGGVLTASVVGAEGATVAPATLSVEIIPRSYSLGFDVAAVSVVAGGTTEVMVVLTGNTELIGDDEFTVMFSYEPPDGGVSAEAAMLNAEVTSATVSLVATAIAQDGTLTASVVGAEGAVVESATLSVEIIPRLFSLAFDAATVSVIAGGAAQVGLTLTGDTGFIGENEAFATTFTYIPSDPDGGGVEVVALAPAMFTADNTAAIVTLEAATTATGGKLTALVLEAEGATVAPATLDVEIALRLFSLAFDATTVSVVAGATTQVTLTLTGDRAFAARGSHQFAVMFSYAPDDLDGGGVEVVALAPAMFTADNEYFRSTAVVTLEAATTATEGTLTASVVDVVGTMVESAVLPVEIVPRAFTLAFDATTVSVVAGGTTQVGLALTGDTELIGENEAFAVMFSYESDDPDGGGVEVVALAPTMFTADNTAAVVMLEAATTATESTLTALVLEAEGAVVESATLSVEITPRLFSLVFDAATVSVVAGATAQVGLALTGDRALAASDRFAVEFSYDLDGGVEVVALEPMEFSAGTTTATVTLSAATTAMSGVLTALVVGAEGAMVAPATLGVEIVPRRFQLSLRSASPLGAQLDAPRRFVREASDGPLPIPDVVGMSANSIISVPVDIDIRWLAVQVEIQHPARGDLRVRLISPEGVDVLLHNRTGGFANNLSETYTSLDHAGLAVLTGGGARGNWELIVSHHDFNLSGSLQAWGLEINTITPERFVGEASDGPLPIPDLGEVNSIITVPVDTEIQSLAVRVEIRHPAEGDLRVRLISPEGVEVLLHDRTGGFADDLFRIYTSADQVGLAALTRGGTRGDWELIVADTRGTFTGTLEGWGLEINARTQLGTGESVPAVVTLSGVETLYGESRLFPSETLLVELRYTAGGRVGGVTMSPPTLEFHSLALTNSMMLEASLIQTSGLLELIGSGLTNAVVESTPVLVQVVRQFRLAFATPDGAPLAATRIMAGDATEVTVVLDNPETLGGGAVVLVTLSTEIVVASKSGLILTRARSSETLVISAPADADMPRGAVVASGELQLGDGTTADYIEVVAGSLAVEIVPRAFTLTFDPASVSVVAGATTQVTLTLTGDRVLAASDRFAVMFSYVPDDPDGGVEVAESVVFTAGSTEAMVTLEAATTAMGGVLTASVFGVDGATFAPARLSVEIIPRSYSLAFNVETVSVVAGDAAQVLVVLTGNTELIGDDEFTVMFSYEPPDGGVSAEAAMLNAAVTSATVSLVATAIAQDGTLTASVSGVDGATFAPATLDVEITLRLFSLAFDATTVSVVAGATTQVMLTLTGDTELIGKDEAFAVTFLYAPDDPDGGGVEVVALEPVTFTADNTAAVVMLEAATTATESTLTALVLEAEGATVAPATLGVEIVPRAFMLAFDATTVSVVAGATAQVTSDADGRSCARGERSVRGGCFHMSRMAAE